LRFFAHEFLYVFYTAQRNPYASLICDFLQWRPVTTPGFAMDFVYLALLTALVALTSGFLRLCARLEKRP
jgi:hypothetical protein